MICIIAGDEREAYQWARSQQLNRSEWFFPSDESALMARVNFHVLVVGTAGQNVPASYFNRIYTLAKERGNRKG